MHKSKNILGIDTGSTKIGYGIISRTTKNPQKPQLVDYGYVDLSSYKSESKRLFQLHLDIKHIIKKFKPESIAIEGIYYFKNSKTITPVIQSKGVILFTAEEANVKVYEYAPLQIKQTIAGYGKADKSLIEKLVKSSLNIASRIRPDDASDALAIALCHLRYLTSS